MAVNGSLFNGTKFWLSSRTPSKARFVNEIQSHGGVVVPLEKLADMLIVDHMRKDNNLPNSYSYRYIDLSLRNGRLENKEDHLIPNSGVATRTVGDSNRAAKGTRTPFTAADDQFLINWMSNNKTGAQLGNTIFQELERHNARHTWQSWRDRWVRRLRFNDKFPENSTATQAPPTPPMDTEDGHAHLIDSIHSAQRDFTPRRNGVDRAAKSSLSNNHHIVNNQLKQITDPLLSTQKVKPRQERVDSNDRQSNSSRPIIQGPPQRPTTNISKGIAPRSTDVIQQRGRSGSKQTTRKPTSISNQNASQMRSIGNVSQLPNGTQAIQVTDPSRNAHHVSMNKTPSVSSKMNVHASPRGDFSQHLDPLDPRNSSHPKTKTQIPQQMRAHSLYESALTHEETTELKKQDKSIYLETDTEDEAEDEAVLEHDAETAPSSLDLNLLEQDEELAISIWKELLRESGTADEELVDDAASLVANAGIIPELNEADFQIGWDTFWRENQQKSEDEWIELFNEFCIPFYKTHIKQFSRMYRLRKPTSNVDTSIQSAKSAARPDRNFVMNHSNVKVRETSPELGSYRQQARGSSPELRKDLQRSFATPEPLPNAAKRKRAASPREIPESPTAYDDEDFSPSKRSRFDKFPASDSRPSIQTRDFPHRHVINELDEDAKSIASDIAWPALPPQTEFDQQTPFRSDSSRPRLRLPSETLTEPEIQASVDQQIWSEQASAQHADDEDRDESQSSLEVFETAPRELRISVEDNRRAHSNPIHEDDGVEEGLFVSDDSVQDESSDEEASNKHFIQRTTPPGSSLPSVEDDNTDNAPPRHYVNTLPARDIAPPIQTSMPTLMSPIRTLKSTNTSAKAEQEFEEGSESESELLDVAEWLARQRVKGHSDDLLTMVLNATTMQVELASKTLKYYLNYNKLPSGRRGVWTTEDDAKLLEHSRTARKQLEKKHGKGARDLRKQHLEMMKERKAVVQG